MQPKAQPLTDNRVRRGAVWLSTVAALALVGVELVFAARLGVARTFKYYTKEVPGYLTEPNWGLLYVVGLPAAVFTCARLSEWIGASAKSLNMILTSADCENKFSDVWDSRHKYVSFCAPWAGKGVAALLAFGLGWRAISAPENCRSTAEYPDWQTVGGCAHPDASSHLYFVLNVLAYCLQFWLIYLGLTVLFRSLVFSWEVLNAAYREPLHSNGGTSLSDDGPSVRLGKHRFSLNWDYKDVTGRCGLSTCDRAFFFYMIALILAFSFALLTDYQKEVSNTFDEGGWLLTGGVFLLLPALLYLFIPFWTNFPRRLPPQYASQGLTDPIPWPFGEKLVSLFLLTAVGALITKVALVVMAVRPQR